MTLLVASPKAFIVDSISSFVISRASCASCSPKLFNDIGLGAATSPLGVKLGKDCAPP